MVRITTSNYGAVSDTQFAWATTDDDIFDREFDLYRLAQAVENHTHGPTRGLPVAAGGLANNSVSETTLAPLSVSTGKIVDGAVTNIKLGAGAVTYDKILWPLVQPSNDMTGGFRLRDTSNTYALGFYIAANGLAVFGAGASPGTGIPASLILGQGGQVTVGTIQGGGHFNVMQSANTVGSGVRTYHTNQSHYAEMYINSGTLGVLNQAGNDCLFFAAGRVSIGAESTGALLHLVQPGTAVTDGLFLTVGSSFSRMYINISGHTCLDGTSTNVLLMQGVNALSPATTNVTALGQPTLRWTTIYALAMDFSGTMTGVNAVFSGTVGTGPLSCTNLSVSNVVTHLNPSPSLTWALGSSGTNRWIGGNIGMCVIDSNGIFPFTHTAGQIGSTGSMWGTITVGQGFQTGGGSWTAVSDDKVKDKTAFKPYTLGLETLQKLEPVYFKYSGEYGLPQEDKAYVGFRAQALQKVIPDMVGSQKMKRTERSNEEDILTVNDSQLPYLLLNCIKELQDRVIALETRKN